MFEIPCHKEAVMKLSAPNFLEMWREGLSVVGSPSIDLARLLFEDAACAGIAADELRTAAGGDLDAYLAML